MLFFRNDYGQGCIPEIMEYMNTTNGHSFTGYGMDAICQNAKETIKKHIPDYDVDIHFLVGGTITNQTIIKACLKPFEAVIACDTGHIATHETGAIEAVGHKVIHVNNYAGKINPSDIRKVFDAHMLSYEHMVYPKMVYISNPSEVGTIYSNAELTALSETCHKYGLYLFLDGARLGYGLAAPDNDLTLPDIAALCDVFYIGGTKVGALFGEAVVIKNPELAQDFRYLIKQNGGMLAKGRLLGLQFDALFTDGLYQVISAHAIAMAEKLREAFTAKGYTYLAPNRTNQIFVIVPDAHLAKISEQFEYSYDQRIDATHSCVRFCTGWATREENVDALIRCVEKL